MSDASSIAQRYRRFAAMEAHGVSPLYEQFALGVADDRELIAVLAELPAGKQQPNLLLAAVRFVAALPSGFAEFRDVVLGRRDELIATMLAKSTQTNEPARCAAFYPVLASLPQPLALLEVGASAGLCLLPDRYGYDYQYGSDHEYGYGDGPPAGDATSPLVVSCRVEGGRPSMSGPISVAWRAGIDLNPLDVTDPDDVRWLETLIWPEQRERQLRLHAAIAIAKDDPPRIHRGDLVERLTDIAGQAPSGATLVVFHTATLNYLSAEARAVFVDQVGGLDGHWLSQEAPGVLPGVEAQLPPASAHQTAAFVLAHNGYPVAFTAPHGGHLRWLVDPAAAR